MTQEDAKVICFASAKGGSGKTVVSATLGHLLAGLGKNILLVDGDAATNGMTLLFLDSVVKAKRAAVTRQEAVVGLYEVSEEKQVPTPFVLAKNLDMIPAAYIMQQTEEVPPKEVEKTIARTVSQFRGKYDYILLDAQAGADPNALSLVRSADEVVIVSEYDPISSQGVMRLQQLFPSELLLNRTWVLFNKILPEFVPSIGEFLKVARYLSPIPWDADVVRAYARGTLAINMDKPNTHTLAVLQTAETLFGQEIEDLIRIWRRSKEEIIRAPARDKVKIVESRAEAIRQAAFKTEAQIKEAEDRSTGWVIGTLMLLGFGG
jgi:MinD-like ATPase involved in chromosome partitioning or flagellar assembly